MPKKKTHEKYVSEVYKNNPNIEVLEEYRGNEEKILHRCKICSNEWLTSPCSILQGHGCPKCGRIKQANTHKRTQEEYIKEVKIINPNIEVIGTYTYSDIKIAHRCKICDYEWNVIPNSILQGYGCPKCADVKRSEYFRKSHNDYVNEISIINPNIEVIGTYVNAHKKIEHKCKKCNYIWNPTPDYIINGGGCPVCAGKAIGFAPEYRNSIFASKFHDFLHRI